MTLLECHGTSPAPFKWTDGLVDDLKRMWIDEERTALDIAVELGVTRNTILGKIDRLKLGGRPCDANNKSKTAAYREGKKRMREGVMRASTTTPYEASTEAPSPHACALVDLTTENCHWPIGEPGAANFHFCGGKANGTYCAGHHRIAYRGR